MNELTQINHETSTSLDSEYRNWAMALHLSQFLGYLFPVLGFAAPIVIWQVKKDRLPYLDNHGRIVANWLLTSIIYWCISFFLMFVLVGFMMLYVMGVICVIFPLIGGIKASQGETWKYPMSIPFFSLYGAEYKVTKLQ